MEAYIIADNGQEKGNCDIKIDLNKSVSGMFDDSFDMVFCLEVFEYIWNPNTAVETISKALHKDGIAYMTFPFLYPVHNPRPYDFLRFTRQGAIRLLEENCLVPIEVTSRIMTGQGKMFWDNFIAAEGMHAARGFQHNELGWIIKCQKC